MAVRTEKVGTDHGGVNVSLWHGPRSICNPLVRGNWGPDCSDARYFFHSV